MILFINTVLLLIGSVLFWVGLIINIDSDYRLIRLRSSTTSKSTTSSPSKSAYKIPQGNLKIFKAR